MQNVSSSPNPFEVLKARSTLAKRLPASGDYPAENVPMPYP